MPHCKAFAAIVAAALLAVTASSASAYPSSVSNQYRIETVHGTCIVDVWAQAVPAPTVVGTLTGYESVNCDSLTITPYRIYLSGGFSNTSLDRLNLLGSGAPDRICEWQKACYWSRSDGLFPPGDHYVTHGVDIDVAPYAVGQTYTSFPADCRVSSSDSGKLICDFKQWVTMSAPAT